MLVPVGVADDLNAVAVLREAVDEGDDAGGAGERRAPLRFVFEAGVDPTNNHAELELRGLVC